MTTTIESSKIPAHKKSTTELAIWLEGLSQCDRVYHTEYDNFREAAQRLRELDKPDCVWTATKVAELDCFKPACTNAVMYFDLEKKHFCPNCGGAVKDALS